MDPDPVAAALRAADARARMSVRRHPLVAAVILSGPLVRAVEVAAAVNRTWCGDLDSPAVWALADALGRDLLRARRYAVAGGFHLGRVVSRGVDPALISGRVQGYATAVSMARAFEAAVALASELVEAIDGVLAQRVSQRLVFSRDEDLDMARELGDGVGNCLARALASGPGDGSARALVPGPRGSLARKQVLSAGRVAGRALDQGQQRARALERVCAQGLAGRLGIATAEGLGQALADGALDDFTSADLTGASLADADLTGVRWSLTGTTWPPGTDIKALVARSQAQDGVLVFKRRGLMWQPSWLPAAPAPRAFTPTWPRLAIT